MDVEGCVEKRTAYARRRLVFSAINFLEDHLELSLQLVWIESAFENGIGQNVNAGVEEATGKYYVVDGLVEAGPGVDLTAGAFDLAGDFADRSTLGSLKEHVLVHVGDATLFGFFVCSTHANPDLDGGDRSCAIFQENNRQSVIQTVGANGQCACRSRTRFHG